MRGENPRRQWRRYTKLPFKSNNNYSAVRVGGVSSDCQTISQAPSVRGLVKDVVPDLDRALVHLRFLLKREGDVHVVLRHAVVDKDKGLACRDARTDFTLDNGYILDKERRRGNHPACGAPKDLDVEHERRSLAA